MFSSFPGDAIRGWGQSEAWRDKAWTINERVFTDLWAATIFQYFHYALPQLGWVAGAWVLPWIPEKHSKIWKISTHSIINFTRELLLFPAFTSIFAILVVRANLIDFKSIKTLLLWSLPSQSNSKTGDGRYTGYTEVTRSWLHRRSNVGMCLSNNN